MLAVAQDAGGAETTRPWIRPGNMEEQYPQPVLDLMGWDADAWRGAAAPQYPCLIDERHQVSLLYGMVNVPTAVWIDEEGRMVRPPEPAGVNESFKAIDLASFSMPPEAIEIGSRQRNRYLDAVRDWVRRGPDSPAALPPDEVRSRIGAGEPGAARAAAHFRLAAALYRRKGLEAARPHFAEAARLRPENWAYQRQARQLGHPDAVGELDAGPEFWASLEARGEGAFYPPIDLPAPT
ncbi:MAG TPA: hypothetical protein VGR20_16805 [Acidimicrobiia bacterium]|nr:hypothetical protein [Acidimicrobiia bacterium]